MASGSFAADGDVGSGREQVEEVAGQHTGGDTSVAHIPRAPSFSGGSHVTGFPLLKCLGADSGRLLYSSTYKATTTLRGL